MSIASMERVRMRVFHLLVKCKDD